MKSLKRDDLVKVSYSMIQYLTMENDITIKDLKAYPEIAESHAKLFEAMIQHNVLIEQLSIKKQLNIEDTDDVRTYERKGMTFRVVDGGKA